MCKRDYACNNPVPLEGKEGKGFNSVSPRSLWYHTWMSAFLGFSSWASSGLSASAPGSPASACALTDSAWRWPTAATIDNSDTRKKERDDEQMHVFIKITRYGSHFSVWKELPFMSFLIIVEISKPMIRKMSVILLGFVDVYILYYETYIHVFNIHLSLLFQLCDNVSVEPLKL